MTIGYKIFGENKVLLAEGSFAARPVDEDNYQAMLDDSGVDSDDIWSFETVEPLDYIVNIEGSDPFIAEGVQAVKDGLYDLYEGEELLFYIGNGRIRIEWKGGDGELIEAIALESTVYR
jgi:hypothetical protein